MSASSARSSLVAMNSVPKTPTNLRASSKTLSTRSLLLVLLPIFYLLSPSAVAIFYATIKAKMRPFTYRPDAGRAAVLLSQRKNGRTKEDAQGNQKDSNLKPNGQKLVFKLALSNQCKTLTVKRYTRCDRGRRIYNVESDMMFSISTARSQNSELLLAMFLVPHISMLQ
jgi:hypothetical protein